MLALTGFTLIISLLALMTTKKISVYFGLTILPIIFALLAGFSPIEIADFAEAGIVQIAPTGVMLMFAILFFGVLFDAGLFDPVIRFIVKVSAGDPIKITIGTAIITACAQLDGSGSSTVLIVVSSLLPLYKRLNMQPVYLAIILGLTAGVMNILPWGGPTIRAAKALDIEIMSLFIPMWPIIVAGLLTILLVCFIIGLMEKRRIGIITLETLSQKITHNRYNDSNTVLRHPKLFLANLALTIFIISLLTYEPINITVPFLIGLPLALLINYPKTKDQQERISAHAQAAILTASVIFCAGIFTGIVSQTGMINAMANFITSNMPNQYSNSIAPILAILSTPMSIFFDPDSFYFGILPVLAEAGQNLNVPIENMARAALIGQTTVGAFLSPLLGFSWLLASMTGVELSEIQRKGILPAMLVTLVMTITAWIFQLI